MAMPIPKRPSGYSSGKADAPIQIEAFIDLQCPYSKKAWPTLLAIAAKYGQERVRLTIQPIVLAEHHQSWDVTKAAVAVAAGDASRFLDFAGYLYAHQEEYTNAQFRDRTQKDLYALLARFAADYAGEIDTEAFFQRVESEEVEQAAKIPLASQRHAACGPPRLSLSMAQKCLSSPRLLPWRIGRLSLRRFFNEEQSDA
jgi:hypothetical protein